jgi:hypothetical protein
MNEVACCLNQHLVRRRLTQVGREIPGDTFAPTALHERRKSQASLDVAEGIQARRFNRGTRQVHVSYRFLFVC